MKKKLVVLLFCGSFGLHSEGQEVEKTVYGINFSTIGTFMGWLPKYSLSLTVDQGIHTFGFGTIVDRNWEGGSPARIDFLPTGLQLNYQIHPSGKEKRFDFFFETSLNLFYDHADGLRTFVKYDPDTTWKENFTGYRIAYEVYAGYGFNFNLTKKVYLNHSVGVGYYWDFYQYHYEVHKPNNWSYSGGGVMLKIGLGYRFNSRGQ